MSATRPPGRGGKNDVPVGRLAERLLIGCPARGGGKPVCQVKYEAIASSGTGCHPLGVNPQGRLVDTQIRHRADRAGPWCDRPPDRAVPRLVRHLERVGGVRDHRRAAGRAGGRRRSSPRSGLLVPDVDYLDRRVHAVDRRRRADPGPQPVARARASRSSEAELGTGAWMALRRRAGDGHRRRPEPQQGLVQRRHGGPRPAPARVRGRPPAAADRDRRARRALQHLAAAPGSSPRPARRADDAGRRGLLRARALRVDGRRPARGRRPLERRPRAPDRPSCADRRHRRPAPARVRQPDLRRRPGRAVARLLRLGPSRGDIAGAELEIGRSLVVELPPPRRRRRRSAVGAEGDLRAQVDELRGMVAELRAERAAAPDACARSSRCARTRRRRTSCVSSVEAERDRLAAELEGDADRRRRARAAAARSSRRRTRRPSGSNAPSSRRLKASRDTAGGDERPGARRPAARPRQPARGARGARGRARGAARASATSATSSPASSSRCAPPRATRSARRRSSAS